MDLKRANDTLAELAKEQNLPLEKVICAIEEAITEAYNTSVKNNDRTALEAWSKIPRAGELPTAAEMLAYLAEVAIPQKLNEKCQSNNTSEFSSTILKS